MNIKYTTSLPKSSVLWLGEVAKQRKVPANRVLIELLEQAEFEAKQQEYQQGFKKARQDQEMLDMSREDVVGSLELIEKYEGT